MFESRTSEGLGIGVPAGRITRRSRPGVIQALREWHPFEQVVRQSGLKRDSEQLVKRRAAEVRSTKRTVWLVANARPTARFAAIRDVSLRGVGLVIASVERLLALRRLSTLVLNVRNCSRRLTIRRDHQHKRRAVPIHLLKLELTNAALCGYRRGGWLH